MAIISAIIALLPYLKPLLDWVIKTPEEKRAEALALLPAKLKEISDREKKASDDKDPSLINSHLNDR